MQRNQYNIELLTICYLLDRKFFLNCIAVRCSTSI